MSRAGFWNPPTRAGWRLAALAILGAATLSGCAYDPLAGQRLARYTPDVTGRRLYEAAPETAPETVPPANGETADAGEPDAETGRGFRKPTLRVLEPGDKVAIYLRGIPKPEELQDIVDDQGNISLSLLGLVSVAGKTTSEVEREIEKAYVAGGYYTQINVIVVSQEANYFVRGEVKREGQYDLQGDMTLLQAIAAAGGYTRFANARAINIIREDEIIEADAVRIEDRKADDPRIKPDDIIVVPKRRW